MKDNVVKSSGSCCSRFCNSIASLFGVISLGKYPTGSLYHGRLNYASWFGGILSLIQYALVVCIVLTVVTNVVTLEEHTMSQGYSGLTLSQMVEALGVVLPTVTYVASSNEVKSGLCYVQTKVLGITYRMAITKAGILDRRKFFTQSMAGPACMKAMLIL